MNQLDESWNKKANQVFFSKLQELSVVECYEEGASDFQNKAIEELEKYLDDMEDTKAIEVYKPVYDIIKIIKQLKAD